MRRIQGKEIRDVMLKRRYRGSLEVIDFLPLWAGREGDRNLDRGKHDMYK